MRQPLRADIVLSSGRTIRHTYMANNAQAATPTTGPDEMTNAEWLEYVTKIRAEAAANSKK